jgi:prevent-host-death family protein
LLRGGTTLLPCLEVYTLVYMEKSKTVAEARRELPALLDNVERGGEVTVTRRGKPIAVLVSYADHKRHQHSFRDLLAKWSASPPKHLDGTEFRDLRDKSVGR